MVARVTHFRLIWVLLVLVAVFAGCRGEDEVADTDTFSFVVYPGSRYLGQLTDITREAHRLLKPNEPAPPVAIYDTEASVEDVAHFYAKSYGYASIAPDPTNKLSAATPQAYYRTGDLTADVKSIEPLLPRLNLNSDVSKAVGTYKAADIAPRPNRPRVTVQRPYYDVITSQVVDRTLILMSR